jgi:hypothetical protein
MSKALSTLNVGDKIKIGSLYGNPIVWKIADKNHAGFPSDSVTVISDRIIKIAAFDGKEASNADASRKTMGNNRYLYANLLQWLNTANAANAWYTAQHSADAAPTTANCNNYNGYDTVAGFLNGWTADEKALLLDTTVVVNKASVDGGGQENVTSKVFLPSYAEVGLTGDSSEGSILPLFSSGNASRVAYPSADAVANSNYTSSSLNVNTGWYWWCRSPYVSSSYFVRFVDTDGSTDYSDAYDGLRGVRPAWNLLSFNLVSDTVDGDGCYTMIYNEPPTVPGYLTPDTTTVSGGGTLDLSWGESTDPEGTAVSYTLERKVDTGSWTAVYVKGSGRTYTDTAPVGASTMQYRVKAIDADNVESDYRTSAIITVTANQPPSIPESITVPVEMGIGGPVSVEWGISTDPDGGVLIYLLEVSIDDTDVWTQIYSGEERAYTDTAPAAGALTLKYRVRAKDQLNMYSAYRNSGIVTLIASWPPVISGQDGDLGVFGDSFTPYEYTVTEQDDSPVSVTEYIDEVGFRTYNPALGEAQQFNITGNNWMKILNGTHTVKIIATNASGVSATRILTFSRDVRVLEFYTDPLNADSMPSAVTCNIQGSFPTGSSLTVLASNNANDAEPFWQDITGSLGAKAYFTNTEKTASSWGVSFHITLNRGTATLPCYITSVGGGFA